VHNYSKTVCDFQEILDQNSNPKTKIWWEKHLLYEIPFRGVGIPQIRELLANWRIGNSLENWSIENQCRLAIAFFNGRYAEDKIAGILYLQNFIIKNVSWKVLLPSIEDLFDKKLIFDWNTNDWLCVRVLGPMLKLNGKDYAEAVASWRDSEYLWKARSSLVPFVYYNPKSEYYDLINPGCITLIKRKERFAKTAVGWILREIYKTDKDFTTQFVHEYLFYFTQETIRNALKYMDKVEKKKYLEKFKAR
jgi:3-methyladenine DNA glycosylase AlkD